MMNELGHDEATEYTYSDTYRHHSNFFHGGYEQAIKDCSNYTSQPNNTSPINPNQSPAPKQGNSQGVICIIINGTVYGACGNTNGQS
jgi:hypothetical protein